MARSIARFGELSQPLQHLEYFGKLDADALPGVLRFIAKETDPLLTGSMQLGRVRLDCALLGLPRRGDIHVERAAEVARRVVPVAPVKELARHMPAAVYRRL